MAKDRGAAAPSIFWERVHGIRLLKCIILCVQAEIPLTNKYEKL